MDGNRDAIPPISPLLRAVNSVPSKCDEVEELCRVGGRWRKDARLGSRGN
jgi:hypothetical protein